MEQFFVENFGCRATQADGASIVRQFQQRGLLQAESAETAHVVVLNSCTVTAAADADLRSRVRRIHRENPSCRILVTGCYAQRAPEEIAALPGVAWVVGNSHKSMAAEIAAGGASIAPDHGPGSTGFVPVGRLARSSSSPSIMVGDIFAHTELLGAPVFDHVDAAKTRPNLKVQDGCGNRCSFCVIPFVRGNSRSLPLEEVVREAEALVEAGNREVVISGINLGRWGRDLPTRSRFPELLKAILGRTTLQRLRISSVEPMDWSDELIELVAGSARICKHAHIPLQSGSDRVLRRMHRKYRPRHYAEKVRKIHEAMPDAAIGADVMVGFPGETEEEFDENRRFIEELPFTYLHVFSYSCRPGTAAATMPDHVPVPTIQHRNRVLRQISAEKNKIFRQSFVGKQLEGVTLHRSRNDSTEALTTNFLKLEIAGLQPANQIVQARIQSSTTDGLIGQLV